MSEFYEIVRDYALSGKRGTIVTLVNRAGSAPRDAGAKMFVGEDGLTFGTIGGGSVEAEFVRQSLATMGTEESRLVHYTMRGSQVEAEGMICGGDVDVLLEPVLARYSQLYDALALCVKQGRQALIITRFGAEGFSKSLIDMKGESWGDLLSESEAAKVGAHFAEKEPLVIAEKVLFEPLNVFSRLYIFGGGHVSQFLARAAKMVDFNVVVVDDREEFANRTRFPEADEVIVETFEKVFDRLPFTGSEFIVIVTRGHRYDAQVLADSLKKQTRYVGMIGSRRKVKMVLDFLREQGFSEDALQRVYAPIGIDINSETPQEIAISSVAELIKVRGES